MVSVVAVLATMFGLVTSVVLASSAHAATSRPSLAFSTPDADGHYQIFWSPAPGTTTEQLTSDPDHEARFVSLASDGSFATFSEPTTAVSAGDEDVYEVDTATKAVTNLTNLPGQELYPAISPDLNRVAFNYAQNKTAPFEQGVFVIDRNTRAMTRISSVDSPTSGAGFSGIAWSRDGKQLAYAVDDYANHSFALVLAGADGSTHKVLSTSATSPIGPCTWSPNDMFVLCSETTGQNTQIWAINVTTGARTQITNDPAFSTGALTIANDWMMYYEAASTAPQTSDTHIRQMWLGDVTSSGGVFGSFVSDSGPSVAYSGPVLPAPAGFLTLSDGGPDPTPSPSSSNNLTVTSVTVAPASPDDVILRRGIAFTSTGGSIARYEYAWALTAGAKTPTTPIQRSTTGSKPQLYYGPVNPGTTAYLFARAIGTDGTISAWTAPKSVKIPPAPKLLFGIDSVTSGHHNDYNDKGKTTCDDPKYGYAPAFAKRWLAALPSHWHTSGQVLNVAHSGFATQPRAGANIPGTALTGGVNACKYSVQGVPIVTAENALKQFRGSWNRWIATGGINDTNWGDVVAGIITGNFTFETTLGRTISARECANDIANKWNGQNKAVQASITGGVKKIATRLRAADPALKMTWLSYYNAAGTGTNANHKTPYLPATCEHAFDVALNKTSSFIKAGLPPGTTWVDTDSALHGRDDYVQPLKAIQQLTDGKNNPAGWPHPNQAGGLAISELLSV